MNGTWYRCTVQNPMHSITPSVLTGTPTMRSNLSVLYDGQYALSPSPSTLQEATPALPGLANPDPQEVQPSLLLKASMCVTLS